MHPSHPTSKSIFLLFLLLIHVNIDILYYYPLVVVVALSSSTTNVNGGGRRHLGHPSSELLVSEACLGTMTWGVQNTQDDAFQQLDISLEKYGVNFIDTAELYPVPLFAPNWRAGKTEEILGEYLNKRVSPSRRDELVIATKICGFMKSSSVAAERTVPTTDPMPDCRLDAKSIRQAVDASLRRLQTDRIDLMQIHWPDRYVPAFGRTLFRHDLVRKTDDIAVPIEETASALRDLIEEGKIRAIGLSNETPLGVAMWVEATEQLGIRPKLVSIQNSYNLLDRRFDSDLAEMCHHYGIGLLPWSVLAGGSLSGKYDCNSGIAGATKESRFITFPKYMSRWSPDTTSQPSLDAVKEYTRIATENGMTPSELAIAFIRTRPFVSDAGSVIVGATTIEQLEENLKPFQSSFSTSEQPGFLPDDILAAIDAVHMKCRDPCCSL